MAVELEDLHEKQKLEKIKDLWKLQNLQVFEEIKDLPR